MVEGSSSLGSSREFPEPFGKLINNRKVIRWKNELLDDLNNDSENPKVYVEKIDDIVEKVEDIIGEFE